MPDTYLEFCVVRHHSLEPNTNTLNHTQEDGTHNGRVSGSLVTTTDSQSTTGKETSNDYNKAGQSTISISPNIPQKARPDPGEGGEGKRA